MLTQAVHVHVMRSNDSKLTKYYSRKKEEKGPGKAAVATSKKLLETMYLDNDHTGGEVSRSLTRPLVFSRVEEC